MIDDFLTMCEQAYPGDVITYKGKRWEVIWSLTDCNRRWCFGLSPISASADTTNTTASADAPATSKEDSEDKTSV